MIEEQLLFIRSDGTTYHLISLPERSILNMSGWGKPSETISTQVGPYQHGETPLSYRLNPRTINMQLLHKYCDRSEWYAGRSTLLAQLGLNNASPNNPVPGVLRRKYIENKTVKTRDLDCFLTDGLVFRPNDSRWQNLSLIEDLQFTAYNPIIYDPTLNTETIDTFSSTLILPFTFPFVLGMSAALANITYVGTWETYPTIEIDGPAVDIGIINLSTDKYLRLEYGISVGETVTFDLEYDVKTVTNNFGDDLAQYIRDSDLGEFSLIHDIPVEEGLNIIYVALSGNAATTEVRVKYYDRYYGI